MWSLILDNDLEEVHGNIRVNKKEALKGRCHFDVDRTLCLCFLLLMRRGVRRSAGVSVIARAGASAGASAAAGVVAGFHNALAHFAICLILDTCRLVNPHTDDFVPVTILAFTSARSTKALREPHGK